MKKKIETLMLLSQNYKIQFKLSSLTWLNVPQFHVPCDGSPVRLNSWCIYVTQNMLLWCHNRLDFSVYHWIFLCTVQCYYCWWHRQKWLWSSLAHPSVANHRVRSYHLPNRNNLVEHKQLDRMVVHDLDHYRCLQNKNSIKNY